MSPPGRGSPTLKLKIISAKDVSHASLTDKMDVYAVVSITDNNTQKKQAAKTPIDFTGDSNPTWNHTVKFSVNEKAAGEGFLTLNIKLFSYWLKGENDLYLGEVNVSVHELLSSSNENVNKWKSTTYPIEIMEGTKGTLSLSYWFKPVAEPVAAPVQDYSPSFAQSIYPNPNPTMSGQPFIYSPQFQTAKTKLTLQLVINFAKNIRNVNILNMMNVYASVKIHENNNITKSKIKTPTVFSTNKSPTWNHAVTFSVEENLVREGSLTLIVDLINVNRLAEDESIGEVKVPLQELFKLNPPSPLINGDDNGMKSVTESVRGSYGKRGTLNFTFKFKFEEEPAATQPFIMYLPVSHQTYGSPDQGTLGYMAVQPGMQAVPSNGLVPIYMQPQLQHQSHGYQPYLQEQPQKQPQLQPHQLIPQTQTPSQQPTPLPQMQSQPQTQTQSGGPTVQAQGGTNNAALVLGAGILGRVIGGALAS